ncbi:hypothetical protein [Tenacibaculum sp. MAR_2009_124]|nr:hypothetical protein [Tenacibaculum sp. MAR_2009_124]
MDIKLHESWMPYDMVEDFIDINTLLRLSFDLIKVVQIYGQS